jgi:hypothetical protein
VWLWAGRIDGGPVGERWAVSFPRAGRAWHSGKETSSLSAVISHSGNYIFFLVFLPSFFF